MGQIGQISKYLNSFAVLSLTLSSNFYDKIELQIDVIELQIVIDFIQDDHDLNAESEREGVKMKILPVHDLPEGFGVEENEAARALITASQLRHDCGGGRVPELAEGVEDLDVVGGGRGRETTVES